ncbi:hypothetical protein LTR49_004295 [Elasticomyces elasticus]|nr:hypothetical protein LTR49_004295 [Elasticomyces elasticus]KAK5766477.1 hypothetical protein LTS12_003394 [Elasticomyces elasticus]
MGDAGVPHRAIRKVLVLGNNRIADAIVDALAAAGFDTHQLVPTRANFTARVSTVVHKSESSPEALIKICQETRPDLVISTSGGGSYSSQKEIIDAVMSAGVTCFMPAEFGHDSLNERLQQRLPPLEEHTRIIDYLKDLLIEARLEWVGIATGSLLDHGLRSGNLGFDLKWQSATLHGRGTERFAASSTKWVGRVVAAAVAQWDEVKNQYLYAAGLVTTADEVLECLEQSTGQQWEAGGGDVEDCVREAERRTERGFPDAAMFLMERSVLYDEALDAVGPFLTRDAKQTLGLRPESVVNIVVSAVHEHEHHGKGDCGCS